MATIIIVTSSVFKVSFGCFLSLDLEFLIVLKTSLTTHPALRTERGLMQWLKGVVCSSCSVSANYFFYNGDLNGIQTMVMLIYLKFSSFLNLKNSCALQSLTLDQPVK